MKESRSNDHGIYTNADTALTLKHGNSAEMKYHHKLSRTDNLFPKRTGNPQNLNTMAHKETTTFLQSTSTDTSPETNSLSVPMVKEEPTRAVEVRRHVRQGSCNWCKKQTILFDFSCYYEGREIYCTGLCSDECFGEAAKQIVSVESGSSKPRYISGSGDDSDENGVEQKTTLSLGTSYLTPSSNSLSSSRSKDIVDGVKSSFLAENSLLAPDTTNNDDKYSIDQATSNDKVEMFINKDCDCGPYLNPTKIADAMKETYRGNMQMLLKTIFEDILRSAFYAKTVFGFIKPGLGQCTVSTVFNNSRLECRLDAVTNMRTFWHVLANFTENLKCCPNFFSLVKHKRGCRRCVSLSDRISPEIPMHWSKPTTTQKINSVEQDFKFKYTDEAIIRLAEAHTLQNHMKRSMDMYCQRRGYGNNMRQSLKQEQMKEQQFYHDYIPFNRNVQEDLLLHCKTYTYGKEGTQMDKNIPLDRHWKLEAGGVEVTIAPKTWQIEQVVEFMKQTDLQPYVETFRENEIDGKALLLLEKDLIINHMEFKLGPTIKLLDIIDELRLVQNKIG